MLGVDRDLRLVDITHEVAPQDVFGGALVLRHAAAFFPPGTVHLAVVDPGRERAGAHRDRDGARLLRWAEQRVLTLAAPAPRRAFRLEQPAFWLQVVSSTFHGRDLFAPVAAYLAVGASVAAMGHRSTSRRSCSSICRPCAARPGRSGAR